MSDEETARRVWSDGVCVLQAAHPEHDRYSMDDIAEHVIGSIVAALQAERERCAKICEAEAEAWYETFHANPRSGANSAAESATELAAAIRREPLPKFQRTENR